MTQENSNRPKNISGNKLDVSWNDSFHAIEDIDTTTSGNSTTQLDADWDTTGGPLKDHFDTDNGYRQGLRTNCEAKNRDDFPE